MKCASCQYQVLRLKNGQMPNYCRRCLRRLAKCKEIDMPKRTICSIIPRYFKECGLTFRFVCPRCTVHMYGSLKPILLFWWSHRTNCHELGGECK